MDTFGIVYATTSTSILSVSPGGSVVLVAGHQSNSGSVDGEGTNARFSYPSGLVVNPAGTIIVADLYNNKVRAITGGVVTTIAGGTQSGAQDGVGASATFYQPQYLALNSNGDLFVVDSWGGLRYISLSQAPPISDPDSSCRISNTTYTPSSACAHLTRYGSTQPWIAASMLTSAGCSSAFASAVTTSCAGISGSAVTAGVASPGNFPSPPSFPSSNTTVSLCNVPAGRLTLAPNTTDLSCFEGVMEATGKYALNVTMLGTAASRPGARVCVAMTFASFPGTGQRARYYYGLPSIDMARAISVYYNTSDVVACATSGCNSPFTDACAIAQSPLYSTRNCGFGPTSAAPIPAPAASDLACFVTRNGVTALSTSPDQRMCNALTATCDGGGGIVGIPAPSILTSRAEPLCAGLPRGALVRLYGSLSAADAINLTTSALTSIFPASFPFSSFSFCGNPGCNNPQFDRCSNTSASVVSGGASSGNAGGALPPGAMCAFDAACASSACRGGFCCSATSALLSCSTCSMQSGSCLTFSPGETCASPFDCATNVCRGGCCCAASAANTAGCTACRCLGANGTTPASAGECSASAAGDFPSSTSPTATLPCNSSSEVNSTVALSRVISFPPAANVSGAMPLVFVPATSPLNNVGVDIIVASPAACAAYEANGATARCDARSYALPDGTYYYLGTAASLGMAPAPSCDA